MSGLENKEAEITELTEALTKICLAKITDDKRYLALADKLKRGIFSDKEELWKMLREDEKVQKLMDCLLDNSALKKKILIEKLLSCDFERAQIEIYDKKRLTDPNQGHWDLWQKTCADEFGLTARNPVLD